MGVKAQIACKRWDCPVCGKRKRNHLRKRIFNGPLLDYKRNGYTGRYDQKFLTLTPPGAEYRKTHTIRECHEDESKFWNKLITATRKKYGKFGYIKVSEPQRDGYPHIHALLIGKNIADKRILKFITKLWCKKYGMGYVRLNVITKSIVHGVRYITKYITKENDLKIEGARRFSASRGALEPVEKKEWWRKKVTIGFVRGEDHEEVREYDLPPDSFVDFMEIIESDFKRNRAFQDGDIDSLEQQLTEFLEDQEDINYEGDDRRPIDYE